MEYKLVYRLYDHAELSRNSGYKRIGEERGDASKTQSVNEAQDWSDNLNKLAKEGFAIMNSGALQSLNYIVFWALLEKP